MSFEFNLRLVGMIVFAVIGIYIGIYLGQAVDASSIEFYVIIMGLLGMASGLILTPYLTTRPARALRRMLARLSAQTLAAGLVGLIVGLIIAALLTFPLSLLPDPFGKLLPFVAVLLFGLLLSPRVVVSAPGDRS